MANSENSFLKNILYGIILAAGTAWAYNFIGIDSSGRKIEDTKSEDSQIKKVEELNKKELELKEKELKLKIIEIENKYKSDSNLSELSFDLSGNWVTADGVTYIINQSNNLIKIEEYSIFFFQQFLSFSGQGMIKDNQIEVNGYSLLGQAINFNIQIIDDKTLTLSGFDNNGNQTQFTLTKS